jgi:hypothetical protein
MSTAYHPQTDGQTEHYNQELEAYLRIYCAYKPDEWSNKLSLAQFAHNARTHEAIKQSPFQLMYGTKPVALPEVSEKTNSPVANNRINQLYKSREEALATHDLARVKMMERTTNCTKPFKVNDQVWLESKNLKIPYQSRKLAPVTTQYGLLHYANLIRRTGPIIFLFNLLNLAMPLTTYAVRLVLLIFVPLSSLPCYLYDAVLILTSDILYSLIDMFLSILRYISTHVFQSPYFIPGKSENLPTDLRPVLEVSPLATPRSKPTVVNSSTYRAPESSESESEPSDKEVDQQLEDSSDQVSESVLSPLTGLSLIAQGKSKEPDPRPSKPHRKSDPFDEEFEDAEEPEKSDEPEEDLKEPTEPSNPGSPIPPGGPIPDPPTMATPTPTSLLGTCPSFKGKRKSAKEFMTNIELYFNMNKQRISTNQLKILLALQHISEDAQQWKENEKTDLDDSTNVDKQWNDWTGFKTRFLKNWEELDSPGNAFSELLKLNKRKFTTRKKQLSIIKYTK